MRNDIKHGTVVPEEPEKQFSKYDLSNRQEVINSKLFSKSKISTTLSYLKTQKIEQSLSVKKKEVAREQYTGFQKLLNDRSNIRVITTIKSMKMKAFCPFLFKCLREIDNFEEQDVINSFVSPNVVSQLFNHNSMLNYVNLVLSSNAKVQTQFSKEL